MVVGAQGAVIAAELLSVAAFLHGTYAQAFPSFGSERTRGTGSGFFAALMTMISGHGNR